MFSAVNITIEPNQPLVVYEPEYLKKLAALLDTTDPRVIGKLYIQSNNSTS